MTGAADSNGGCGLPAELELRINHLLSNEDSVSYRGTLLIEYNNEREFVGVDSAHGPGVGSLLHLSREVSDVPRIVPLVHRRDRQACSLAGFYGFNAEGQHVVAGRSTYRVTIRPRDTLRLGYVMDLDVASHLPLRVVSLTPEGQVLERYEFAEIELSPAVSGHAGLKHESKQETSSNFEFAALPPGFSLVDHGVAPVDYLVVSDGLAAVSVFIEPRPEALTDGEGVVLRGSTLTYTRGTSDRHLITVIGEVPVTTARLLADGVRRRKAE